MTFLNIALLAGLLAASIPIIIHLLNRRRIRVVKWGAMHLLELTIKKHSRRLNLEQLILLLIRCLIPAVLALCLARPVLRSFQSLVGNSQSSTVILLDNSYSMDYGGGARSTFQLARQVAAQKIAGLSRGSDAAIVPMAAGEAANSVTPSVDTVRLNQLLNQSEADGGRAAIPASLDIAGQLFGKMQHNFREILLVSDFQRINWAPAESAARNRALEGLRKLPIPPHVTLFHVGAEGRDNVAVESLEFSRLIAGVNQPMQIRANLHNFGDKSWPELRVYFRVDGKERAASQISLAANEQRQLLFTHSFEAAGSHVVEVFADADSLKVDNVAQAAIPVWDKVPVLLVNGDPSSEPMRGETDFLEIALQPFGQGRVEMADLITNRVITANQLTADSLNSVRVCVLANVERLSDDQLSQLSFFVREGGGLLIFPGNHCNTDWYNQSLKAAGLLPLSLSALRGSVNEGGAVGRVLAQHFTHPAMEIFNDPRNGSLADAEVRLWFKTGQPDNQNETIATLAQLDSGDPFLVEKKVGEGRVMFCSTACDADWSNLPTRPVYLPLMQRLATYLASSIFPPRNVEIGKPLIAFFPRAEIGKIVTLTDPAGKKHETKIEDRNNRGVFEFTRTGLPGLYQLEAPDNSVLHFVVSASREESDLAQLTEGEVQALAKELNADVANSWGEYKSLDHARRFGREFWKPLLWVLLVLLFGELILQQWFARRKG